MPRRGKITTNRVRLPAGNSASVSFDSLRAKRVFENGREVVRDLMGQFLREYRSRAPRRTGALAAGFGDVVSEQSWGDSFYRADVANKVPYADDVEYGTERRKPDRTVRRLRVALKKEGDARMRAELDA